jgi:hypothetical protein
MHNRQNKKKKKKKSSEHREATDLAIALAQQHLRRQVLRRT